MELFKTAKMPIFNEKEMRQYRQQVVNNLMAELEHDSEVDLTKWNMAKNAISRFDPTSKSIDNLKIIGEFRGSKNPGRLAERFQFVALAENYLKAKLALANADKESKKERADWHTAVISNHQQLLALDADRQRNLMAKFQQMTLFRRISETEWEVNKITR